MLDKSDDRFKSKFSRTRTGCLRCRRGKRKCNEEKPACGRCRQSANECIYPAPAAPRLRSRPAKRLGPFRCTDSHRFEELDDDGRVRSRSRSRISDGGSASGLSSTISLPKTPASYLSLAFPDEQERHLMAHFLCFGTIVLCAVPIADQPVQFINIAQSLQHPRGSSTESDALLLSFVSIAAVHQSSINNQLQRKYLTESPIGPYGTPATPMNPAAAGNRARLLEIGEEFSKASLQMSKTAAALKLKNQQPSTEISDTLFSSIICVIISQVLMGGNAWKDAYMVGLDLVRLRGGPDEMMKEAKRISRAEMQKVRRALEHLAIVDVCYCLGSGSAPTLMTEPFQSWWFDYAPKCSGSEEWDTFQRIYGMDRGLFELLNRVNMLVHESMTIGHLLDRSYSDLHSRKIQDILLELDVWERPLSGLDELSRIQIGNVVILHVMRVVIHVDLLHYPHSHPVVQTAACNALLHLKRSRTAGFAVGLLYPTVIVGSIMASEDMREVARGVLTALRVNRSYSYDVEEALTMLEKLYALRDSGHVDPSWRMVTNSGTLMF